MRSKFLLAALLAAIGSSTLAAAAPGNVRQTSSGQVRMMANDQQDHLEAWVSGDRGFVNLQGSSDRYSFFVHVEGQQDLRLTVLRAKDGSVVRVEATYGDRSADAEPREMAGGASSLQSIIPAGNADLLVTALSMVRLAPNGTDGLNSLQLMATGILGHMDAPYQPKVQTEMPWDYAAYAACYWACIAGGGDSSRWIACGNSCRAEYLGK